MQGQAQRTGLCCRRKLIQHKRVLGRAKRGGKQSIFIAFVVGNIQHRLTGFGIHIAAKKAGAGREPEAAGVVFQNRVVDVRPDHCSGKTQRQQRAYFLFFTHPLYKALYKLVFHDFSPQNK